MHSFVKPTSPNKTAYYYDQDEIEGELDLPATSKQKQVSDKKCKACDHKTSSLMEHSTSR
jgi:hypothetical protein